MNMSQRSNGSNLIASSDGSSVVDSKDSDVEVLGTRRAARRHCTDDDDDDEEEEKCGDDDGTAVASIVDCGIFSIMDDRKGKDDAFLERRRKREKQRRMEQEQRMMRREESDYESRTEPVDEEDHDEEDSEEDSDVEDDDEVVRETEKRLLDGPCYKTADENVLAEAEKVKFRSFSSPNITRLKSRHLSILMYSRAFMTLSGLNLSYGTKFGLTRLASWM